MLPQIIVGPAQGNRGMPEQSRTPTSSRRQRCLRSPHLAMHLSASEPASYWTAAPIVLCHSSSGQPAHKDVLPFSATFSIKAMYGHMLCQQRLAARKWGEHCRRGLCCWCTCSRAGNWEAGADGALDSSVACAAHDRQAHLLQCSFH